MMKVTANTTEPASSELGLTTARLRGPRCYCLRSARQRAPFALHSKNLRRESAFPYLLPELSFPNGFCWPLISLAPASHCGFGEGRMTRAGTRRDWGWGVGQGPSGAV